LTRIPDELPVEPQTPDAIIGKLNEAINAGLADPKMKARVADRGGTALEALISCSWLQPAFGLFTHFR
jgi:tripartite-type tricarboxylate transporter receptor subunit TctC